MCSTAFHRSALDAADHPFSDIFHPLGAAFFSNATYPETLKLLNQTDVSIEPFKLAGTREMFRYNYTTGSIDANPAIAPQFYAAVSAEIPRYIQLWTQRFAPISTTNYKVRHAPATLHMAGKLTRQQNGVPEEFTVPGATWFRNNNFTALPILLVNPVALYGYGDINIVPAVRHITTSTSRLAGIVHACTNT
jgi:hypothetical protein